MGLSIYTNAASMAANNALQKSNTNLVIGAMTNLDYATAATELDGLMVSVQATQATYAKISQLSLFSVI